MKKLSYSTKISRGRGQQLRLCRNYRGYTQKEVADNVKGVSQSNLSKFENGIVGALTEEKVKAIMKFFDWPYHFLDKKPINNRSKTDWV